jgi:hypothetical protein
MKNPIKSIQLKVIHATTKLQFAFYSGSRSYKQILSDCIKSFYRSIRIAKNMANMAVSAIESFYKPLSYNP